MIEFVKLVEAAFREYCQTNHASFDEISMWAKDWSSMEPAELIRYFVMYKARP